MTVQPESDSQRTSLKDYVATATAWLAVAGAVWFAVMSILSGLVYEPVGVSPLDLGLSSPAILGQASVGLLVSVGIGIAFGLIVGGIWGLWGGTMTLRRGRW